MSSTSRSGSDDAYIHVREASELYQNWLAYSSGDEKNRLNRLPPQELQTLQTIVKFLQTHQETLRSSQKGEGPISLDRSTFESLKNRVGSYRKKMAGKIEEQKRVLGGKIDPLVEEKNRQLREKLDELTRTKTYLRDIKSTLFSLQEQQLRVEEQVVVDRMKKQVEEGPERVRELESEIRSLTQEIDLLSLDKRVSTTASIIRPLVARDQVLYPAVAKAENYRLFEKYRAQLPDLIGRLATMKIGELDQANHRPIDSIRALFHHLGTGSANLSERENRILSTFKTHYLKNHSEEELEELLTVLGSKAVRSIVEKGLKGIEAGGNGLSNLKPLIQEPIEKLTKRSWIAQSAPDALTSFAKFLFGGRFAPRALLPDWMRDGVEKAYRFNLEIQSDLKELDQQAIIEHFETAFYSNPPGQIDQQQFEPYADRVEEIELKYVEILRRLSQSLTSPFYAGQYADVLTDQQTFLRKQVAYLRAFKVILDPTQRGFILTGDPPLRLKDAIGRKVPMEEIILRLKEHPDVKEVLMRAEQLGEKITFWASYAASNQSYEGALAESRAFLDNMERDPTLSWEGEYSQGKTNYQRGMELVDGAIAAADPYSVLQFGVLGGLLGVMGYLNLQAQKRRSEWGISRFEEAQLLKIEMAATAYLKTKSESVLKDALDAAINYTQPKTFLKKIWQAIGEVLRGKRGVDQPLEFIEVRSDTDLMGVGLLFMRGVPQAGDTILEILARKSIEGKVLTPMDKSNALVVALADPNQREKIFYRFPRLRELSAFKNIAHYIDPTNASPDREILDDPSIRRLIPELRAVGTYFFHMSRNEPDPQKRASYRLQKERVEELLRLKSR